MSSETQPQEQLESTRVEVNALVAGTPLTAPIYDDGGVLLLAEGSTITPTFKQRLTARNITGVLLGLADAAVMRLDQRDDIQVPDSLFDESHMERLDSIIEDGKLFAANTGEAIRDKVVLQGCKAYDPETRAEIIELHEEASKELDEMFQLALHGKEIDSRQLGTYVGAYTSALSHDPDSVMAVAAQLSSDAGLADHCLRSTVLAMALGIEMGLDDANLRDLGLCGLLHDWGMIRVPESIRYAARPLTPVELMQIQKHPTYTLEILDRIPGVPKVVALAAYQVHERPNGKGYPRGRHRAQIHGFARILSVADTYTALTTNRPQRPALMPYYAMECLIRQGQTGDIDSDVVRALLHVLSLFPIGSFVLLDDGRVAVVMRRNGTDYTAPIVRLVSNTEGQPVDPNDDSSIIDLAEHGLRVVQALASPNSDQIALNDDILRHHQ